jgi:3D (Asp-Asp-Asp) domain-containing protein
MADSIGGLRARATSLRAEEQAAQLELFALNSRLDEARAELGGVQGRIVQVEGERAAARNRLRVAHRTLSVAEQQLGDQLRTLYQQDRPDPFEIMLGAASLQDAFDGLDSLRRAAHATADVLLEAKDARADVTRLAGALRKRRAALESLRQAAAARAAELVGAQSDRLDYLARLRDEERLNGEQIILLEARARAAQAQARLEAVKARMSATSESFGAQSALAAPEPSAPEPPAPQPTAAESQPAVATQAPAAPLAGRRLTVIATAYSLPGNTASGLPTGPGVVAVDPTVIPMGTRMTIPGYGPGVAADVGTAIKGNRIDVWFPKLEQAQAWGARTVTITLH